MENIKIEENINFDHKRFDVFYGDKLIGFIHRPRDYWWLEFEDEVDNKMLDREIKGSLREAEAYIQKLYKFSVKYFK